MTSKQRAYLRGLANTIKPIFQIGKNGIAPNQTKSISDALESRELIKINVLKNSPEDDVLEIANDIANRTQSEVIQVLGNKITLYKKVKKPKIELPK